MSFAIVGLIDPPTRIAVCPDLASAEEFISTLPNAVQGIYYLDWPCDETVILREP